jgi:acyl carrier protein
MDYRFKKLRFYPLGNIKRKRKGKKSKTRLTSIDTQIQSASLKNTTIMQIVYTQLRYFLNRTFTLKSANIAPGEQLQRDLGLSEWEFLEVVVHLETLFGLTLPDDTLVPALTVEQLCSLIVRHKPGEIMPLPLMNRRAAA